MHISYYIYMTVYMLQMVIDLIQWQSKYIYTLIIVMCIPVCKPYRCLQRSLLRICLFVCLFVLRIIRSFQHLGHIVTMTVSHKGSNDRAATLQCHAAVWRHDIHPVALYRHRVNLSLSFPLMHNPTTTNLHINYNI